MIQVEACSDFDFGGNEYRRLFEHSSATAFQAPLWLTAYYRHFGHLRHRRPLVLCGRSQVDRALQWILPLVEVEGAGECRWEFAYGGVTDYACPIVSATADLGAERPASTTAPATIPFTIEPVRQCDLDRWRAVLHFETEALAMGQHELKLDSGTPVRASFSDSRRAQIARKTRRLAELGAVELNTLNADELPAAIAWARRMRAKRFRGDPLQGPEGFAFYSDVATRGADSGFARTYQLRCGGERVALCFGIVHGARYHYLLLACDYRRFAKFSPGILLLQLAIEDWARRGGEVFDFTIGDEPFKTVFRCQRAPLWRLRASVAANG